MPLDHYIPQVHLKNFYSPLLGNRMYAMRKSDLRSIAVLGNFKWEVLLNHSDQSPFFTSDFPVAIEEAEDPRVLNRIVPLAPNLAIRIKPNVSIDRERADLSFSHFEHRARRIGQKQVAEINQLIVRCAERTVFYREEYGWIPKFIARNRHYRVEPTTRKAPTSCGTILFSTQRVMAASPLMGADRV